ncbi:DUF4391 domain-containing protein [Chryseobacterium oryzae]|uniref:DUF4391 domain-containing protein n=1 Tax=Chryseobacterium oryzae TaxID=2929799 RepID=A0ABY4BIB0_9FLAO|nr:DUF4391 domain-containing protein [Chryseobacterium oryzae]UOE37468.1 DUF4391 domain-containing protein [Chryseobacterium oryzae]
MFDLPKSTVVKKVIPKNAFDAYTNSKQKKIISEKILRITWANKLSQDTINLTGKDIQEIQIFEIDLKEKLYIKDLLLIIDKAIPYQIIFQVKFNNEFYISTSAKHSHPTNDDNAVVDYTFSTDWNDENELYPYIELKNNLDWVYKKFCEQINDLFQETNSLDELIFLNREHDLITRKIAQLKTSIANCQQFNRKVELNLKLKQLEKKLLELKK